MSVRLHRVSGVYKGNVSVYKGVVNRFASRKPVPFIKNPLYFG
jgi:hypothetical protein